MSTKTLRHIAAALPILSAFAFGVAARADSASSNSTTGSGTLTVGIPSAGIVDIRQPGWVWNDMTPVDDPTGDGTNGRAGKPGSYGELVFHGCGVTIFGIKGPNITVNGVHHQLGRVLVTIDGKAAGGAVEQASSVDNTANLLQVKGLSSGNHVLHLQADGAWIFISHVKIDDEPADVLDTARGIPGLIACGAPAIQYVGDSWSPGSVNHSGYFSTDARLATKNGDAAVVSFNGSGVDFVTKRGPDAGNVGVYMDGQLQATVSCYNPTPMPQSVVYTALSSSFGAHTLKVVKQSGRTLMVNAFIIHNDAVYNDTSQGIQYQGAWEALPKRGYGDFGNDVHATKKNGDYAELAFNGSGIDFVTETYSDEGNVDIYIDTQYVTTVNCITPTRMPQRIMYSVRNLTKGPHKFTIVKRDGEYMLLDALVVYAAGQ